MQQTTSFLNQLQVTAAEIRRQMSQCIVPNSAPRENVEIELSALVGVFARIRSAVAEWNELVFTAAIPFESEVEEIFKRLLGEFSDRAQEAVFKAHDARSEFLHLPSLIPLILNADQSRYLLHRWISPRPSVAPAPRIRHDDVTAREIREALAKDDLSKGEVLILNVANFEDASPEVKTSKIVDYRGMGWVVVRGHWESGRVSGKGLREICQASDLRDRWEPQPLSPSTAEQQEVLFDTDIMYFVSDMQPMRLYGRQWLRTGEKGPEEPSEPQP
jgi:hypothetical protein